MQVELKILRESKMVFISFYDSKLHEFKKPIILEYSPDMKDIKVQVLLRGYKILEKTSISTDNFFEIFNLVDI